MGGQAAAQQNAPCLTVPPPKKLFCPLSGLQCGAQPDPFTPADDDKPPVAPDQPGCTHVVKQGEDINMIAQGMGTTVAVIQQLNPGMNFKKLKPGQVGGLG